MRVGTIAGVVLVLSTAFHAHPQEQQSKYQSGWPCSGKVDPSFVRTAEATGGKVLLFSPYETAGAADDMSASSHHRETVFRAGGDLDAELAARPLSIASSRYRLGGEMRRTISANGRPPTCRCIVRRRISVGFSRRPSARACRRISASRLAVCGIVVPSGWPREPAHDFVASTAS